MAVAVQQEGGPIGGIGAVYRLSLFAWLENQVGICNINYKLNVISGVGGDLLGDCSLAMYSQWVTNWKALISTAAVSLGCKMSQIWPRPPVLAGITSDGGACSGGVTPLPTQVTGIIKWNTQNGGPAFRGRIYIPFPYTAAMDTDYTPTATYVAKLVALASVLNTVISITPSATTYELIPVIWHRAAGKTGVPAKDTWDVITGSTSEKLWATQRRRGDFGRLNADIIH